MRSWIIIYRPVLNTLCFITWKDKKENVANNMAKCLLLNIIILATGNIEPLCRYFRENRSSRRDRADESDDRITIPISLTTLIVRWWQRNPPNSVLHLWFVSFCLLNLSFLFWYFLVSFVTAGCSSCSLVRRFSWKTDDLIWKTRDENDFDRYP